MSGKKILGAIVCLFVVLGCQTASKKNNPVSIFSGQVPDSVYQPRYAKGFTISYYGHVKLIEVKDPWDSVAAGSRFLVGPCSQSECYKDPSVPYISLPVLNWACFSSTQVVFADKLGVLETLKSVAEPQYISHPLIQQNLKKGLIRDVGLASAADVEVLLATAPQFIFVSPFMDNHYGPLTEAGLLVVPDAGYLEPSPLARAEWVMLFSAFFDKEQQAAELFTGIEKQYLQVRAQAQQSPDRPSVITGTLYRDVWYLPAGQSYMARLFADAGTVYPYREVPGTGSQALDFETVFNQTWKSDFWVLIVNHSGDFRAASFLEMDGRYEDFDAYKKGQVLYSNSSDSQFFEKGVLEPHVILKDLAALMHPNLFPLYQPVFFEFLQQ
jgi:iron complex transport system substrate-binding protein